MIQSSVATKRNMVKAVKFHRMSEKFTGPVTMHSSSADSKLVSTLVVFVQLQHEILEPEIRT